MKDQRKRVAKRLASGLLAGALALGGLAISGDGVSARTPVSLTTNRISGADRYATAVAIARDMATAAAVTANSGLQTSPAGQNPTQGLVIASGEAPYDALAGSVLANPNRPLLLVRKDSVPTAVLDYIADFRTVFRDNTPTIYVLGGESAISAATFTAIRDAVTTSGDTTPPTVVRISGADRYATAKAISDVAGVTTAGDTLIIVNGENDRWADALSAGVPASENGWPIILTTATGLQASAKAKIDAYIALSGSALRFLIVGGTSVVPESLINYLVVDNGVPPANITRFAGADRYATNRVVMGAQFPAGIRYNSVALVSGESPWDALAAGPWAAFKNASLLMTPVAGGNVNTQTVAATASVRATLGLNGNQNLYVIGGSSAVAETARAGYLAVASGTTNLTSTLTCGTTHTEGTVQTGTPSAILTLSGALSPLEWPQFANQAGQITEGTANATHAFIALTPGQQYLVSLPAATTVGRTITWRGIPEGEVIGAGFAGAGLQSTRTVAGSSCTYSADTTVPSVTAVALAATDQAFGNTTSAGLRVLVSSDEAVTIGANVGGLGNFVSIGATSVTTSVTVQDVSAGASQTQYILTFGTTGQLPPGAVLTAGGTITIRATAVRDAAGNNPAAPVTATIVDNDATAATLGTPSVSQSAVSQASIVAAPLVFTAVAEGLGGSAWGAKGSAYSLSVVTQRGLVMPTVALNTATKVITVTADTGYHTVDDIANALAAAGLDGDWAVTSTGATTLVVAPTLTNATVVTGASVPGISNVRVRITASEPVILATAGVQISVAGLTPATLGGGQATAVTGSQARGATAYTRTGNAFGNRRVEINFSTNQIGTGTLTFLGTTNGMYDASDNRTQTAVTFTLS